MTSPTGFDDEYDEPAPIPRRSADSAPSVGSAPTSTSPITPAPVPDFEAPLEVSTTPQGMREPSGTWHKVVKAPAAATDPTPVMDAGVPDPPPPIPRVVKVVGLALVAALMVLAAWLGLSLGSGGPTPTPTPPTPTPELWPLDPPVVVGEMVRGDVVTDTPAGTNRTVVRADYSDGTDRLVLVLTRPESDVTSHLEDAGVTGAAPNGTATCGRSVDSGDPVCATVTDETAVMLLSFGGHSTGELADLVEEYSSILRGQ